MAAYRGRYVLLGMAIIVALSVWRAVSVEMQQRGLEASYEQAKAVIAQLEQEQQALSDELSGTKESFLDETGELKSLQGRLQAKLQEVQAELDDTITDLVALQSEHEALQGEHASLNEELDFIATEKRELELRLTSLDELKHAIRDVRRQMRAEGQVARQAKIAALKREDEAQLAAGNSGYVVRRGRSTIGTGRRVQVHVLEPQFQ